MEQAGFGIVQSHRLWRAPTQRVFYADLLPGLGDFDGLLAEMARLSVFELAEPGSRHFLISNNLMIDPTSDDSPSHEGLDLFPLIVNP